VLAIAGTARAEPASLPRLGPAPNFALTTQQNDRLWLTHLRGRVVVLTFFCTTCDVCPGLLPSLLELSRSLDEPTRRRIFFVAISVDPRRDTWVVLRRFARDRGADPRAWAFLTTDRPAEIDVVARWYDAGVERASGRIRHACRVTLIDGAGQLRGNLDAPAPGRLREAVEALLPERGAS
jgi:cytochrome oxidase Cu insertion factor (SCO1/SenC/PrrC family)